MTPELKNLLDHFILQLPALLLYGPRRMNNLRRIVVCNNPSSKGICEFLDVVLEPSVSGINIYYFAFVLI